MNPSASRQVYGILAECPSDYITPAANWPSIQAGEKIFRRIPEKENIQVCMSSAWSGAIIEIRPRGTSQAGTTWLPCFLS